MRNGRMTILGSMLALLVAACGPAAEATPTVAPTPVSRATPTVAPGPTRQPTAAPTRAPATAPSPRIGGIIKFPVKSDPPGWDPIVRKRESIVAKSLVFSRLFTMWPYPPTPDCKSKFQPWLVKEWRWVDDVTAEFKLRPGVRFHDKPPVNGRELTAQDVAFSIDRFRKAERLETLLVRVPSVEVVDKYTLRTKLSFPWAGLPLEVFGQESAVLVLPSEAGGSGGQLWEQAEKSWIGTGSFMFQDWQPGVKWWLTRNPNYWREEGTPYAEAIEYLVMPEASTQMAAMRGGKLTLVALLGALQVEDLRRSNPAFQVFSCLGGSTTPGQIYFNTKGPPFDDVRVRRAVSMAIDRQALADTAHWGTAEVVAILPPTAEYALSVKDLPPEVRAYVEYSPERARKLLAEAGYAQGLKTVLNASGAYFEHNYRAVLEAVAAMLKQASIDASLNLLEAGRYQQIVVYPNYPVGQMAFSSINYETPESVFGLANPTKHSGNNNRSFIQDPEYEAMYEEWLKATDEARRSDLARKMQIREIERAYRVVFPWVKAFVVVQPGVRVPGMKTFISDMYGMLETMSFER